MAYPCVGPTRLHHGWQPSAATRADLGRRPSSLALALRYDEDKADLIHDEEYEAVLHPLPRNDATVGGRGLRRPRPAHRGTGRTQLRAARCTREEQDVLDRGPA